MESIAQSAVAGLIAALTATAILGSAKCVRQWSAKRQDVRYLRNLLTEGRKRVLEAGDTFHKGMNATSSGDALRAAQYNNMVKRLGIALEKWMADLSHDQRKDIFDALDWYHTDSLQAVKKVLGLWMEKRCLLIFQMEDGLQRRCHWKWRMRNSRNFSPLCG